jgi:alkylhydroperoxidase family enzyme
VTRVPLVPARPADRAVAAAFDAFWREGREPISLHRALANAPALLAGFTALGQALRHTAAAPRALRELLILRIAQLTGSDYEWCHHVRMALAAGVPRQQVDVLSSWQATTVFDARQRAVLGLAEGIHRVGVTDAAFDELKELFSVAEIVELVVCAAHYEAVARIVQALDVEVEPDYRSGRPATGG